MPTTPEALRRPVPVERIAYDADGRPRIRDTGIDAVDVSNELGVDHLSEDEVLRRHPELEPADLDAIRAHDAAPIAFHDLLNRVLGPEPTHDDVLAAYLFLPRIMLSYHEHPNAGTPMRVRSSFEASFTDAGNVDPSFIKAVGELVFLDHVGKALKRDDQEAITRPWKLSSVERALERFTDLSEAERAVLWALRNALAHDFSLVNQRTDNTPRDIALRHSFRLDLDGDGPLVTFPDTPWDGTSDNPPATHVNLKRLTELAAEVRARIFQCYDDGTLRLGFSPQQMRRRYIFVHGASSAEFDTHLQADENARWPPTRRS